MKSATTTECKGCGKEYLNAVLYDGKCQDCLSSMNTKKFSLAYLICGILYVIWIIQILYIVFKK